MITTITQHDTQVPILGLGTWELRDSVALDMVGAALEAGYRHIDTARAYGNEVEVGQAIRQSQLPREEIFLTSKIWRDQLAKPDFLRSTQESLEALQLDYVDLLLIHWPSPSIPLRGTIEAILEAKANGWAKNIGVSNFPIALLQECLDAGFTPFTNQVEYHPFLNQDRLLGFMKEHDILMTAYSPIAKAKVIGNPVIKAIGQKYAKQIGRAHV